MSRRLPARAAVAATACLALGGLAATAVPSAAAPTGSDHLRRLLAGGESGTFPGSEVPVGDVDRRGPALPHLASARDGLGRLGAGLHVSWTQYGTPLSLTRERGFLATGLSGSPQQVARTFLRTHAALWGLSATDVDGLRVVIDEPLAGSTSAYSVSFNQAVGGILVAQDGYVVVGVSRGRVASVTSSLVPAAHLARLTSTSPVLTPQAAVLAAARDAGVTGLKASDLQLGKVEGEFQTVRATGLAQLQRTRLRVLPTTTSGARLVWETDIQDVAGGRALATISFVDARTGAVLLREDAVETLAAGTASSAATRAISTGLAPMAAGTTPGTFQGSYSAKCSAPVAVATGAGDTTFAVQAASVNPSDDITIKVFRNGTELATIDTATSPDAGTVAFTPALTTADKISVAVCPFDPKTEVGTTQFFGSYLSSDSAAPGTSLPGPLTDGTATGPATWRAFASNPTLATGTTASPDDRYLLCSGKPNPTSNLQGKDLSTCSFTYNDYSRLPYDADPLTGMSTLTTLGNNALTSNAQASSSLTPGGPFLPPVSPTRDYAPSFTDQWHTTKCDPTSLVTPQQADINAAIVNLFVGHNRIHDFSYRLGLTEKRGALQTSNFGAAGPNVAEGDPELGNAQNAALSNDAFTVSNQATTPTSGVGLAGRDNANQITLQDGVPGITNQYLFQPVVGFYSPSVDGDLDASVFLHEYTHAISNRLIAGPATSLGGQQGRSMGESWSDLDAIEYLNAFGLAGVRGEDPFSVGAYATGDPVVGIRDYNLAPSKNPLNYSDFGFDATGPEVHADGEIWNAAQMTVRQALINRHEAQFHYADRALQVACALGRTATGAVAPEFDKCPGNRRYIQYLYDALVLQANGSPSMVDMKDIELAAVMMRDPADYDTVAEAFALRGLGVASASVKSEDTDPTPSFAAPKAARNGHLTFVLKDALSGARVKGSVFIGDYQARSTAVATTLGGAAHGPEADLLAGSYALTVQAPGYGLQRFTQTVAAGTSPTIVLSLRKNVASKTFGATATGNAGALRLGNVLDDDEATNGAFDGQPVKGRQITVKLAGRSTFDRFTVSALHHPAAKLADGSTEIEGRFIGIRSFDLQASNDGGKSFTTVYRSSGDFFPSNAPRPVAPDLIARSARLSAPVTADTVRLVIRDNACTGGKDFNHEQENDPTNPSDCRSTATNTTRVTVTELEVFQARAVAAPTVVAPTTTATRPTAARPTSGNGPLPATGGSVPLAALGLLMLLSTGWVVRRKLA